MDRCTIERERERDCIGRRTIWTDVQIERERERDCIGRRTIWTDVQIERERERESALEGEQYGQMYK